MQSFRTELENPVVEEELLELGQKIAKYKSGVIPEDRFKSLRLARGIYGQRQPGVQMIRIKIPHGNLNRKKLERIAQRNLVGGGKYLLLGNGAALVFSSDTADVYTYR